MDSSAGSAPDSASNGSIAPSRQISAEAQLHREASTTAAGDDPADHNLSSIVEFNRSFNANKRPAEADPAADDPNKRLHVEATPPGLTSEEASLVDQVRAHIAAVTNSATYEEREQQQQQQQQQHQQRRRREQERKPEEDEFEYEEEGEEEEEAESHQDLQGNGPIVASPVWGTSMGIMDPYANNLWDANQIMRIQSLPILDNLSSQILQILGKGPYQDTINIVTQPDSDQGQAYNTVKSLFDQTKKLYTQEAFLSADDLKLEIVEQRATIRKVNLATFVSSVFGSHEVGFFHLNEHFLDTFVPDGGRLLKNQGSLYLDLKTQAYISAMAMNERTKEEILEDLFPANMDRILLARRPGAKQLTPSEADFVARLMSRRNHLMQDTDHENLSEKYLWQDFLKEVSGYVSRNHETIVAQSARRPKKPSIAGTQPHVLGTPMHNNMMSDAHRPNSQSPQPPSPGSTEMALENELFGPNTSYMGAPPLAQPPVPQQSQPTQVLYERARLAATSKSSPSARRAGLPSQRRPWSTEEENALMAGLDCVKGPHWSQILAMFGAGGTVSEALKDRNQVQLKDKARNLKLFFLKSGIEVPYYLQFVTGELKTRAPGQAAKNAAKKQVENSAREDAAHAAAVTALGNAHRENQAPGAPAMSQANGQSAPQAPMGLPQEQASQSQMLSPELSVNGQQ